MGLPALKADEVLAKKEIKTDGFFDKIIKKSINLVLPQQEIADDYKESKEKIEAKTVKKTSKLDRKTYSNNVVPINSFSKKVEERIEVRLETEELAFGVSNSRLDDFLKNTKLGKLASKITGENIEKDISTVQKLAGDELKLKKLLNSAEKIKNLKEKLSTSFLGKIASFFGKTPEIKPEDLWDKTKKRMRSFWEFKKVSSLSFISAFAVYKIFKKYKKELMQYFSAKKIIGAIGGVVERVQNMGSKATELLEKFKPTKEKTFIARKMITKAPKVIASFLKNPRKGTGAMIEFLKKGNALPEFAQLLKEKKIKGFKFRGSGPAMIAILSQKVISETIEKDDLENPETFAQKWVPGVGLFQREWPTLKMAIQQNGLMNSKTELFSFILQAGFDIATVWAIVAFIFTAAPLAIVGGLALKRGGFIALKQLIGKAMTKYGKSFAKKGAKKQLLKKAASFSMTTGGSVALQYAMVAVVPKVNEKVIEYTKSQGSVVARQLFTTQQMRAYDMYKEMYT